MLSVTERHWADERLEKVLKHEARETRRDFINDAMIEALLAGTANPPVARVREILAKARSLMGLTPEEAAPV
ncbi:hypothetical protein SDD30_15465 [Moorella naiadis]|uniref:hypothetical protein n=1 Tax=Moorella naiadis (nom. illeg.) TaxID=3093670 RepID=UPI003D9CAC79